jgi:hypothetical protein
MTWTTTHTNPTTRTPEALVADIVVWEHIVVDIRWVVFKETCLSSEFKAVLFGSSSNTDAVLIGTLKAAKQVGMSDNSFAFFSWLVEASLETTEYKISHPDFKLPPKTCISTEFAATPRINVAQGGPMMCRGYKN